MINTSENTFYKQMSQQTANPATPAPIQNMSFSGAGLNDAILGGSYNQITIATFVITAVAGTPNKFSWVETGGSGSSASNVNMTGSAQTLADGVTITFPATTGHTAGNTWTIVVIPTAREFWNSAGLKQVIWTDGSVVTMTGAGGAIFNPAAPGTIGATTPGIIHTTSAIFHGATSGTVTLNPPAIAGTQAYTLPTGYPGVSGYALTCTTGGVMSWAAVSANWASPDAAIGTGTPVAGTFLALASARHAIVGTADVVQLSVKGNGTQTANLFEIKDSSDNVYLSQNTSQSLKVRNGIEDLPSSGTAFSISDAGGIGRIILGGGTGSYDFRAGGGSIDVRIIRNGTSSIKFTDGSTGVAAIETGIIKFSGTNTTGAGSAALGANSPAVTNTAPYTWIQVTSADGSQCYVPAWK